MSGYVPTPADGWGEIVEVLTDSGKPWPASAVVTDLRWYVDAHALNLKRRGVESPTPAQLVEHIPGRPTLCKRWNWTDHRVRTMLRDAARWWDPERGNPPSPADRQPTASESPADLQHGNVPNGTVQEESPADRQPTASESPADLHRRADPPSPTPTPTPGGQTSPPVGPDDPTVIDLKPKRGLDFAEFMRVWNQETVPEARRRGGTPSEHERLTPSAGTGKLIRQRLNQHGLDACLAVQRWYATGNDASFLRENGFELDTLFGPKFDKYHGKAKSQGKNGNPMKPARPFDPPRPPPVADDDNAPLDANDIAWLRENGWGVPGETA